MTDINYQKGFSERLHKELDRLGYDRHKRTRLIADKLGLTTSPVSKWLNGHTIPLPSRMQELCEAFNLDQTYLISGQQDFEHTNTDIDTGFFHECINETIYREHFENLDFHTLCTICIMVYNNGIRKKEVNKEFLRQILYVSDSLATGDEL